MMPSMYSLFILIHNAPRNTQPAETTAGAAVTSPGTTGSTISGSIRSRTAITMGYLKRNDVSFHYALADAFTVCDSYFCSVHANTRTQPNRSVVRAQSIHAMYTAPGRTAPASESATSKMALPGQRIRSGSRKTTSAGGCIRVEQANPTLQPTTTRTTLWSSSHNIRSRREHRQILH